MSAIEKYKFLHPYLSAAKKLGGKLEVVSFNDDLDGEFFKKMNTFWWWAQ